MKLSDEQIQKALEFIVQKTGDKPIVCPVCGNTQWNLNTLVVDMSEFNNGNFTVGSEITVMPFLTLACKNCGNTLLINAIAAGVVDSQPQAEDPQAPQEQPVNNNQTTE